MEVQGGGWHKGCEIDTWNGEVRRADRHRLTGTEREGEWRADRHQQGTTSRMVDHLHAAG